MNTTERVTMLNRRWGAPVFWPALSERVAWSVGHHRLYHFPGLHTSLNRVLHRCQIPKRTVQPVQIVLLPPRIHYLVLASLLATAKQGRAPVEYLIEAKMAKDGQLPLPLGRPPPVARPTCGINAKHVPSRIDHPSRPGFRWLRGREVLRPWGWA